MPVVFHLEVRGNATKYLLKKSAERLPPREIVSRAKKGFPVPTTSWFRGDLAGFARETLLASQGGASRFFSPKEIEHVLAMHQRERRSEQIYSRLVFDSWRRQFIQAGAPVEQPSLNWQTCGTFPVLSPDWTAET